MIKNIPSFLIEMSNQLNTQNNRVTADPMFEVRHKNYVITEQGYCEHHFEIIAEEGETLYNSIKDENYSELAEHLFDHYPDWCTEWCEEMEINKITFHGAFVEIFNDNFSFDSWLGLPEEIKKVYLQEIEVTVNTHLTEISAQKFIDRKQHDYPTLYIYAVSLCFCEDMKQLRNWIKSLSIDDK